MCIRDSGTPALDVWSYFFTAAVGKLFQKPGIDGNALVVWICLLYTSDAADERSSVDLGGRRIIKQKNNREIDGIRVIPRKYSKYVGKKTNTRKKRMKGERRV